ncbi:hypothetical protein QW131_32020 [Roseibium salinum]|nr:hypothetical protein [Roseibium salinum]
MLTGFGLRIIASDVSGKVEIGTGTTITATGDVTLTSQVSASVDASTPSVVAGVSIAVSKVLSEVTIANGVDIDAGGEVTISATTEHSATAGASVTSGAIVNPAQRLLTSALGDTYDRRVGGGDPTNGTAFGTVLGNLPPVTGYIRIPGPAFAVAVGVFDTDAKVMIGNGSIIGGGISILAEKQVELRRQRQCDHLPARGGNQGFGIAVAVSVSQSDAFADIASDLVTRTGSGGDVSVVAKSITKKNSVNSSAWVREVMQPGGEVFKFFSAFPGFFSGIPRGLSRTTCNSRQPSTISPTPTRANSRLPRESPFLSAATMRPSSFAARKTRMVREGSMRMEV